MLLRRGRRRGPQGGDDPGAEGAEGAGGGATADGAGPGGTASGGSGAGDGRRGGRGFRRWRRTRPFWAGLWTMLSGVVLLSIPMAPLGLLIHEGVAGISGLLMGIFLVILGLTLWLAPGYRVFAGIATLVFAVASLILSNLGGFLIGFMFGVLGGAMAVSWVPDSERPPRDTRDRRRWNGRGGWTLVSAEAGDSTNSTYTAGSTDSAGSTGSAGVTESGDSTDSTGSAKSTDGEGSSAADPGSPGGDGDGDGPGAGPGPGPGPGAGGGSRPDGPRGPGGSGGPGDSDGSGGVAELESTLEMPVITADPPPARHGAPSSRPATSRAAESTDARAGARRKARRGGARRPRGGARAKGGA